MPDPCFTQANLSTVVHILFSFFAYFSTVLSQLLFWTVCNLRVISVSSVGSVNEERFRVCAMSASWGLLFSDSWTKSFVNSPTFTPAKGCKSEPWVSFNDYLGLMWANEKTSTNFDNFPLMLFFVSSAWLYRSQVPVLVQVLDFITRYVCDPVTC